MEYRDFSFAYDECCRQLEEARQAFINAESPKQATRHMRLAARAFADMRSICLSALRDAR